MDKTKDLTGWDALDAIDDAAIANAVVQDNDAAPLDTKGLHWVNLGGRPRSPNPSKSVTIRMPAEVIEYFKNGGKGWQTRLNNVLEDYVKTHKHG